jgi:hypothetical protein
MPTNLKTAVKQARDKNGRFLSNKNQPKPLKKKPVKKNPVVKKTQLVNYVCFVLDKSSSMQHLSSTLIKNYNDQINKLREESLKTGQITYVSLVTFSSRDRILFEYKYVPVEQVKPLTSFVTIGMTALRDAVKDAIDDFRQVKVVNGVSFLLITLTDGYENNSSTTALDLKNLVNTVQSTDLWTLTFQTPDEAGKNSLVQTGVPAGNINVWDTTEQGLEETIMRTSGGTANYLSARSLGKTSLKTFYSDVSNLTSGDLKKLSDVSGEFTVLDVPKETPIRDLVESKLGIGFYTAGCAYYELTKKEVLQSGKSVLLLDKLTGKVYGGAQARQLLGIPLNTECKVEPLNHGSYRIFVKSTSFNRILVRGTKLLVRK